MVRSLYKKGEVQIIKVPKVRIKKVRDEETGQMVTVERTVTMDVHVAWPEQRAIEFVLLNKDPENWKVRPDTPGAGDPLLYAERVRQALQEFDEMHQPEHIPEPEPAPEPGPGPEAGA